MNHTPQRTPPLTDPSVRIVRFAERARSRSEGDHRRAEPFLKGPISLAWLAAASRLPGAAVNVGLILWYRAGLTGSMDVHIPAREREEFGVSRHAAGRALTALERAHLIEVERHRGRSARVRLLKAPT